MAVGCETIPVKELTLEEKVVGTYEGKKDGNTGRLVFLDNGIAEGYENGKKSSEGNRINGSFDGLLIWYYINGEISAKAYSKKGMLEGEYIWYDEDGHMSERGNYKNDIKVGEFKQFYESGEVSSKYTYANGVLKGERTWYYESGILKGDLYNILKIYSINLFRFNA